MSPAVLLGWTWTAMGAALESDMTGTDQHSKLA